MLTLILHIYIDLLVVLVRFINLLHSRCMYSTKYVISNVSLNCVLFLLCYLNSNYKTISMENLIDKIYWLIRSTTHLIAIC